MTHHTSGSLDFLPQDLLGRRFAAIEEIPIQRSPLASIPFPKMRLRDLLDPEDKRCLEH